MLRARLQYKTRSRDYGRRRHRYDRSDLKNSQAASSQAVNSISTGRGPRDTPDGIFDQITFGETRPHSPFDPLFSHGLDP
jgi:hypothetical protein